MTSHRTHSFMGSLSRRHLALAVGLASAIGLTGCFEATDADYTLPRRKYVAMGNSLTAGFQSGGLSQTFQEVSYPNLLAKAMGVEDFEQPLIESPGIGTSTDKEGKPQGPFFFDLASKSVVAAKLTKAPADMLLRKTLPKPYGNLGIPGAMLADVLGAYSATTAYSYIAAKAPNPFFDIVLRGESLMNRATMLQQAIAQDPEVITLEIGNNDILGGVTSGTVIVGKTVTPAPIFAGLMKTIIDSLMHATSATLFIGNIPKPTLTPYVTAIPPVVLNPKTFAPVLDTAGRPIPWPLTEETGVTRVLFPALTSLLAGDGVPTAMGGSGKTIPAKYTLTQAEEKTADSLVVEYNAAIDAIAKTHPTRIVVVDIDQLLEDLNQNKITGLSAKHVVLQLFTNDTGAPSAFSIDGVHPNEKGYRMVAGSFLAAINTKLKTSYTLP